MASKKIKNLSKPWLVMDPECGTTEAFDTQEEADKQAQEYAREGFGVTILMAVEDIVPTKNFRRISY